MLSYERNSISVNLYPFLAGPKLYLLCIEIPSTSCQPQHSHIYQTPIHTCKRISRGLRFRICGKKTMFQYRTSKGYYSTILSCSFSEWRTSVLSYLLRMLSRKGYKFYRHSKNPETPSRSANSSSSYAKTCASCIFRIASSKSI